ncbi:Glutathione S-transferase 2 [Pseudolycoriella hygida]|uniref:glutathione transferase n=1 Tax=Pseudolycoriella hygida TaxID=35572 RepID=A0A9Q0RTY6_9DIPT|nr:Glutathione S-transferase 2 [Pseudolycoriella hygida]
MAPILGYWDLRGLASTIRNLLHYKEVEFEDKLYKIGPAPEYESSEWTAVKPTLDLDFPNLPYYIDGDVKLSQSTTILRYLGRNYDLVGDNEAQTQRIELAEQQAIDLRYALIRMVYFNPNYDKDREEYLQRLPTLVEQIDKFIGSNQWVAGDKLTYVDFLLYDALDFNRLFDASAFQSADNVNNYLTRFENIPQIKAYMSSGKYNKLPVFGPMAAWGGQREE